MVVAKFLCHAAVMLLKPGKKIHIEKNTVQTGTNIFKNSYAPDATSRSYVTTNNIFNTIMLKMANNKTPNTDRITSFWIKKAKVSTPIFPIPSAKNGKRRNRDTRLAYHINNKCSAKKCCYPSRKTLSPDSMSKYQLQIIHWYT